MCWPRLIIQLPESSPAPKIEILDDRQNPVSESDDSSNFVQTQNPKGEKEDMKETSKKEEKDEKTKEKKSLMKKLLGCFSCCVLRPQKKEKQEMVT